MNRESMAKNWLSQAFARNWKQKTRPFRTEAVFKTCLVSGGRKLSSPTGGTASAKCKPMGELAIHGNGA